MCTTTPQGTLEFFSPAIVPSTCPKPLENRYLGIAAFTAPLGYFFVLVPVESSAFSPGSNEYFCSLWNLSFLVLSCRNNPAEPPSPSFRLYRMNAQPVPFLHTWHTRERSSVCRQFDGFLCSLRAQSYIKKYFKLFISVIESHSRNLG